MMPNGRREDPKRTSGLGNNAVSGPEELEWFVAFKLAAGVEISTAMAALKSKTVLSNKLEG